MNRFFSRLETWYSRCVHWHKRQPTWLRCVLSAKIGLTFGLILSLALLCLDAAAPAMVFLPRHAVILAIVGALTGTVREAVHSMNDHY